MGGKRSAMLGIIGTDEMGFVALRRTKSKYFLERHSNLLEYQGIKELVMSFEGRELEYVSTHTVAGKVYLFASSMNVVGKALSLFTQEIDLKALQLKGEPKKVAEVPFKTKKRQGYFSVRTSRDTTKVLVYYKLPYDRNAEEKFGFHVLDENMAQLWEEEVSLPYADALFVRSTIQVSNHGKVYMLGRLKRDKGSLVWKEQPNFSYKILVFGQGSKVSRYDIRLDSYIIGDMAIGVMDNGDIVCGGFYSENSLHSLKGVFYMRINGETQEVESKSYKELGLKFIVEGLTGKGERRAQKQLAKGKNLELNRFIFTELVLRDDGGAVLLGERYYMTSHHYAVGNGRTTTYYVHHYEDMVAISVAPDGKISWATKVAKKQSSKFPSAYVGYMAFVQEEDIYLIFNDHSSFYEGDRYDVTLRKKGESVVSLVAIGSNGKDKREVLFEQEDAGVDLYPRYSKRIDGNRIVIYGEKNKTARFGTLVFSY
jgi:hypothetical protein